MIRFACLPAILFSGLAVADAAFGKEADHATDLEAFDGGAQGVAVIAVAVHRNHIQPGEGGLGPRGTEELDHRNPVDLARQPAAQKRGVEVANVVAHHHAGTLRDFSELHKTDPRAEVENEF